MNSYTLIHSLTPTSFEQKVVERFHRDTTKPASEDVEERVFLVSEERIQVTYHRDDDRIIPAWSIFTTPQDSGNKNTDTFAPDMASTFQVDTHTHTYIHHILAHKCPDL